MPNLLKIFTSKIDSVVAKNAENSGNQLISFGIILFINYPLYHLIWLYASPQAYENLPLRLTASFFCLPLIFKNYWPKQFQPILPYYWYFTVIFCLPFFFVYMLLKNHASAMWCMNLVSIVFFVLLLFDISSAAVILCSGTIVASFFYNLTEPLSKFVFIPGEINLSGVLWTVLAAFFIGAIFSHNKEKLKHERLQAMASIAAITAHELRTPLGSINNGIKGIKQYLPKLMDSYFIAKDANLLIPEIPSRHQGKLPLLLSDIEGETHYANTIINMLLVKLNQKEIFSTDFHRCYAVACIQNAIHRYPFSSEKEARLINLDLQSDFQFFGKEIFLEHVLFNLLKNALYYIHAVGKGQIYIKLECGTEINFIYFKDTGAGISKEVMSKIFTKFFTTSQNGTGLGLTFCKMVMKSFGGDIISHSKEGEYTEFILSFPAIK